MSTPPAQATEQDNHGLFGQTRRMSWEYDRCCRHLSVGCLCEVCALCAEYYAQTALSERLAGEVRLAWNQLRRLTVNEGGEIEKAQVWHHLWHLRRQQRKVEKKRWKTHQLVASRYCARWSTVSDLGQQTHE